MVMRYGDVKFVCSKVFDLNVIVCQLSACCICLSVNEVININRIQFIQFKVNISGDVQISYKLQVIRHGTS